MNKPSNLAILIFLGLIWSTFAIFTKIPATANISPFFISFSRLFIGALFLFSVAFWQKRNFLKKANFRHYALIGFFNSALPFTLFAIAAKPLDSSVVAILDGTVPMFEIIISIFILKAAVDKGAILGVFCAIIGIAFTSFGDGISLSNLRENIFYVIILLCATCSYAGASIYINLKCKHIAGNDLACGSVLFATLYLLPSVFFVDFALIDLKVGASLFGLGFLCTGIAYVFYFKLASEESPRFVVSVVLLIPVFGSILGALFMGDVLSFNKIVGCLMILISLKFILNLSPKSFLKAKTPHVV
jgi:drug/metabolite transporter (DMT)-like permease